MPAEDDDREGRDGPARNGAIGFRHAEQQVPPPPERVSEVAITRFEHVFEVDPRLMERWVLQQQFPNWDTLRIMNSRHDHLDWMHRHFARSVIAGSDILADVDAPDAAPAAAADPTTTTPTPPNPPTPPTTPPEGAPP